MKKLFMLTVLVTGLAFASKLHANPPDIKDQVKVELGLNADPASLTGFDLSLHDQPIFLVGCAEGLSIASVLAAVDLPVLLVTSFTHERTGETNERSFASADIPLPSLSAIETRLKNTHFKDVFIKDDLDIPVPDLLPQYDKPVNTRITHYKGFAHPPALRIRSSI